MNKESIERAEYDRQAVARAKLLGGPVPFVKGNHSKYWATSEQERRGATPIPQKEWFRMFQPLLLEMANTDEGRELLCIPAEYGKIGRFYKNSVHWRTGAFEIDDDGILREEWKADFRIGCKWGNVIRYKWTEFCELAKTFYEKQYRGRKIYRPLLNIGGKLIAAHATTTFYSDTGDGTGKVDDTDTVDGFVGRNYGTETWEDKKNLAGEIHNDSANYLMLIQLDNGWPDRYINIIYYIRCIMLWDTSSLGSAAEISSAVFQPYMYYGRFDTTDGAENFGTGQTFVGNHTLHLYAVTPGSTHELANSDYNKANWGTTRLATPDDEWDATFTETNDKAFNAYVDFTVTTAGLAAISKTGITKWGSRLAWDADDRAESYYNDDTTDGRWNFYCYSVDRTGTSEDPKLVITYTSSDVQAFNTIALGDIQKINSIDDKTSGNIDKWNGITF